MRQIDFGPSATKGTMPAVKAAHTKPPCSIRPAVVADAPLLAMLFDDYRVFYGAASEPAQAEAFVRGLLGHRSTRFFLAAEPETRELLGFVHLLPSVSTIAMRPMWYVEDLYVIPRARRNGIATALMRHAEEFARDSSAERLTLATAHHNKRAQSLYKRLGYAREEHFWYYHLLLKEEEAK